MRFDYIDIVRGLIDTIEERESEHMEQCVELLAECVMGKRSIYTFGASHAGILSEEMYYRAGGLMLMNPIFGREIMLDTTPITHTSHMERLVGYGTELARGTSVPEGATLVIVAGMGGGTSIFDNDTIEADIESVAPAFDDDSWFR